MKFKTIFSIFLLLLALNFVSCGSTKPGKNPETVKQAEKQRAKSAKRSNKVAKKRTKEAYTRYWDN